MRGSGLLVVLVVGCSSSSPGGGPRHAGEPTVRDPLRQPVASLFGKAENGEITKQTRFELGDQTIYGWRLKLPCTGPTRFRETLQLPGPGDWTFDLDTTKEIQVSADKTRAVMTDYSGCYDGWIEHAWSVTPNDPPGEYVLTVEIDGFTPQTFRATFVRQPGA